MTKGLSSAFVLSFFAAGIVLALSSEISADTDKDARAQFKQGVALFEEGKFEQAAIAFDRAYELKPSYKILFNIAQTENELGHYTEALVAYRKYLEQGGKKIKKKRRSMVRKELERLETLVGTLTISGDSEGAQIFVDNRLIGEEPLDGPVQMDIGSHEVLVKLDGREVHREVIKVAGGAETSVKWITPPDEIKQMLPNPDPVAPEEDDKPKRVWTWVALGVGGAAGIAGGVIGGVALSKKNAIEDNCPDSSHCLASDADERDKVENLSLTADIMYGVALAAVAAGVVLFFVEPNIKKTDGSVEVVAAPTASEDSFGLAVSGRF